MVKAPLDEKERLHLLAAEKGLQCLSEQEMEKELGFSREKAVSLSQALEEEGSVIILSFSPLHLLTRDALDFLRRKMTHHLSRHHEKHTAELGIPFEKFRKKFDAPRRVLDLALGSLLREGVLKEGDGLLALADFKPTLPPREEKILGRLEEMCREGEFGSASLRDIQKELGLLPHTLERLLAILVARNKVVRGRDGFYLHSDWLDEVIEKIRKSGRRELSVADFKSLTGLTRKFAIPLLELLDQMEVTRRKGSLREILPSPERDKRRRE